MADVSRLILRTDDIGERSLFYLPPRAHGQHGVAVLPPVEDAAVRASMIAVAVALHLDGTRQPFLYIDGEFEPSARTAAAHAFARAFMEQRSRTTPMEESRHYRAG